MAKLLHISDLLRHSNEALQSWGLSISLALSYHSRTRDKKSLLSCRWSRPLKLPRERRLSVVRREDSMSALSTASMDRVIPWIEVLKSVL